MFRPFVALCMALTSVAAVAQVEMEPSSFPHVRKLFDADSSHPAFACEVTHLKPELNFSFRFQAGYLASWSLKGYSGTDNSFAIVTRVTPSDPAGKPVFFHQGFTLPNVPTRTHERLQVDGAYFFGEGAYSIDLAVIDKDNRVCRKEWQIEVKPTGRGRQIKPPQEPGSVEATWLERWNGVLPRAADAGPPRRLTILMHVAPLYFWTNRMHAYDQAMLLSSLLSLLQQTSFTQVKLVAFNLDQQQELFRQDRFDGEGWDKLMAAMHKLELATVSYNVLRQRGGHIDLLTSLVNDKLRADQPPDVVLFLGPTARQAEKPRLPSPEREAPRPRFVDFEFKPNWRRGYDMPDIMFHITRGQSGKVFRIHSPQEFVAALQALDKAGGAGF